MSPGHVAQAGLLSVAAVGGGGEVRRGEEERTEAHEGDPGPDPDRLGPSAPAPEVADRQEEQE